MRGCLKAVCVSGPEADLGKEEKQSAGVSAALLSHGKSCLRFSDTLPDLAPGSETVFDK